MAASAASTPLSGAAPRACSIVSQVRIPNPIGTPVSTESEARAEATACAEDLVVGRLPANDRREGDEGVRLAGVEERAGSGRDLERAGHAGDGTSSAFAPRRRSVSRAAASIASVTVGFQRAQTTESRRPEASRLPSYCFGEKDVATRRGTRMLKDYPR